MDVLMMQMKPTQDTIVDRFRTEIDSSGISLY